MVPIGEHQQDPALLPTLSPDKQGLWQGEFSDGSMSYWLAEVLAEYLPLCYFNRASWQLASHLQRDSCQDCRACRKSICHAPC